ncbi:hypothetical protein TNCV_4628041 [Trichonephila clavipes]|nr:hypothetical protein TNCV_4628041 [Trichonephila clavipes]
MGRTKPAGKNSSGRSPLTDERIAQLSCNMIGRDRSTQKVGVETDWVDPEINDPPGIYISPKIQPISLISFPSCDTLAAGLVDLIMSDIDMDPPSPAPSYKEYEKAFLSRPSTPSTPEPTTACSQRRAAMTRLKNQETMIELS